MTVASATPGAGRVPISLPSGFLDVGWFPTSVTAARVDSFNGQTGDVVLTNAEVADVLYHLDTTGPTVGDDDLDGYIVGSRWIDTMAGAEYVCVDNSTGAASWIDTTAGGGGGSGTVTSVAMTVPGIFAISGSPITGSGTLAMSLVNQAANKAWMGPTTGADAAPTFRTLVAADIPSLDAAKITTGQLALARGGTGADLSATGGANQIVRQNSAGGVFTVSALAAGDIPNLAASKITSGQLAIAQGGTNAATAAAARTNLGVATDQVCGMIEAPSAKTYHLIIKSAIEYTINSLTIRTAGGTCTAELQIDGVDVTSIDAVAVTSTEQEVTATGANSIAAGQDVTLIISAPSSAVDLRFNLKLTRA